MADREGREDLIMPPSTRPVDPPEDFPESAATSVSQAEHLPPAQEPQNALPEAPTVADLWQLNPFTGRELPGADGVAAHSTPLGARIVAGYEILGELGRGAMGVVYKARQVALKRLVALKMILAGEHAARAQRERFRLEAEAVARLQHPNIVQIHEVGEHNGLQYFSLEYVDGGSLREMLAGTPLLPREAARLVEILARAMHAAHQRGIVHRDLKPANVLLTADGTPKIGDFGLAKQLETDSGQTDTGQVIGTASYMAPEQATAQTEAIGPAADTYALGSILYETLTGRPPFKGATMLDTLKQVTSQEPVPPARLQPTVPRDLETICLKCLAKAPARRYPSAAALADDLQRFLEGRPILARAVGPGERLWRWCRRNPAAASLIVSLCLGTLAAIGLTIWALGERNRANTNAREAVTSAQQEAEQRGRAAEKEAAHLLARVREKSVTAPPGWTWEALADLESARKLQAGGSDPVELRTLIADCLGRPDVRQVGVLAEGLDVRALAFRKDGKLLALGERKDALSCSIQLYDMATRKRTATYSLSTFGSSLDRLWKGDGKYQEGFSSLAFSPDGNWLVAGTRQGKLCRWDTTAEQPQAVVWQGHGEKEGVGWLAFSPDGSQLLSGSSEKTMRWDLVNGWQGSVLVRSGGGRGAYSPDGAMLALAMDSGLKLFVGKALQPRASRPETIPASDLAISPDGGTLALQTEKEIHLVDVRGAERSRIFRVFDQGTPLPLGIQFSADGTLLAASWADNRVRLCDVASGKQFAELFIADRDNPLALFSPVGRYLVVAADRRTLLYELRGSEIQSTVAGLPDPVQAIDFTPDNRMLIVGSERALANRVVESQLTFWDVASRRVQRTARVFSLPERNARYAPLQGAVTVDPGGNMVASVSSLLGAHLVPLGKRDLGVPLVECPETDRVVEVPTKAIQFIGDGLEWRHDPHAAVGRALRIPGAVAGAGIRFRIPAQCYKSKVDGWCVVVALRVERKGDAGPAFTTTMRTSTNQVWRHTRDVSEVADGEYHLHVCEYTHTKDHGKLDWMELTLAVPEKSAAVKALWVERVFLAPLTIRCWLHDLNAPRQELLRFSPDGSRLWGVVDEGQVVSWQIPGFKQATRWTDALGEKLYGFKRMNCLAAGDRWVLVGTAGGHCQLLSAPSGSPEKQWQGPGGSIRAVALHPSETLAALGTQKGNLRLISVPGGAVVADLPPHAQSVEAIDFSRDGTLLVTGSLDQTVRLWKKTGTGFELLLALKAPSGRISSVRLSPDQSMLALVTEPDRAVRLWHLNRLRKQLDLLKIGW
jgi:WD40 repeat protein/tRNA A-37 threonylcarbamoyl transferase component Bud32